MERVCFLLKVRPERIEEYKRRHQQIWPEMLRALAAAGWKNYSLFLSPDGLVAGYFETDNYALALKAISGNEVNRRWQEEMAPFFVGPESATDRMLLRLEEVFHTA